MRFKLRKLDQQGKKAKSTYQSYHNNKRLEKISYGKARVKELIKEPNAYLKPFQKI